MQLAHSTQRNIDFVYCPHPVTVDKSAEWGKGNIQQFPNGVFLKKNDEGIITHGVQPNDDQSAPVGWRLQPDGFFEKLPIWLIKELEVGTMVELDTLDGVINYEVKKPTYLVCQNLNGEPNLSDSWAISVENFNNSYSLS